MGDRHDAAALGRALTGQRWRIRPGRPCPHYRTTKAVVEVGQSMRASGYFSLSDVCLDQSPDLYLVEKRGD